MAHSGSQVTRAAPKAAAETLLPAGPPAPAPIRWLAVVVDWSVVLMGAAMATLVFANVVMHNVFKADIAWTTEFCELLMVWVTFLGGAAVGRCATARRPMTTRPRGTGLALASIDARSPGESLEEET